MEKVKPLPASARNRTSPILLKVLAFMRLYIRATGACICVYDRNYMPIPELLPKMISEKNACLFCIKYRNNGKEEYPQDLSSNPCGDIHINAIRESHRFGGSYTYVCDLGFIFWTSPIFLNKRFIGALMGSGFLGADSNEARTRMRGICEGTLSDAKLRRILSRFPRGESAKIKALAELMLICAKSISVGSEGCHTAMKRRLEQQSDISAKIEELKSRYPADGPRPEYPLDKELNLLEALRRGDAESGKQILNEILAVLLLENPEPFKYIQYRAMELAVLLSRIDGPGFAERAILETNNRHVKSIQETNTVEELTRALYQIVDTTAEQILCFHGVQHASVLKKAEYFILENFTRKISLEEIAGASGFSAPYFSTIFKEGMGENLSTFINRLRVEKASYMLINTNVSLSKITRTCGFEDQSWFSKIFKAFTGTSPGKFRSQGGKPAANSSEIRFSDSYLLLLKETDPAANQH